MSDIVERLRKITVFDDQGRIAGFSSLLVISEAAAEIERLRAENKKLIDAFERRGELIFGREGD